MSSHFCELGWWLTLFLQLRNKEETKTKFNRDRCILTSRLEWKVVATTKYFQDFQLNLNIQ